MSAQEVSTYGGVSAQGGVCLGVSARGCVYHTTLVTGQTPPPETATEVGSTHPTEMHSCLIKSEYKAMVSYKGSTQFVFLHLPVLLES